MNKTIIIGLLPTMMLLSGCENPMEPGHLVGQWVGSDGARMELEKDGKFIVNDLPYKVFDNPTEEGSSINGTGKWSVSGNWHSGYEIKLYFLERNGRPVRQEIQVLISGTRDSPKLYQWVRGEGGERYELIRKARPFPSD